MIVSLSMEMIEHDTAKTIININILRQIEDDLDIDEKISILFLIIEDYANAFSYIFNLYQKAQTESLAYIIIDYVKNYPDNWENKILEALCILDNREVIRKLRISFDDLEVQYIPKFRLSAKNINVAAKCLYEVCESLDEDEQTLLLTFVKSDNPDYEQLLVNVNNLELHILYWMQIKYITISKDEKHLERLLKHLKRFDDLRMICLDLEDFENHLRIVDTHEIFDINNTNSQSSLLQEPSFTERHHYRKNIRSINNGLCIIINQIYFREEHETRLGSNVDCASLSETFQAFGFIICKYENLKRKEMLEKIRNVSKDHGNTFDCLFLCILSHGYAGGVISSDEKEVSLMEIERALCCMELKNVIKIVIIQACQGKIRGSIDDQLARDGLSDTIPEAEDIRPFANFYMFMSTLQGFMSIRHKEQGTWFIQEVCKVLKTYGDQLTFLECVRKIMNSVQKKRGRLKGDHVAQLPEVQKDRLESDFQLKSVVAPAV